MAGGIGFQQSTINHLEIDVMWMLRDIVVRGGCVHIIRRGAARGTRGTHQKSLEGYFRVTRQKDEKSTFSFFVEFAVKTNTFHHQLATHIIIHHFFCILYSEEAKSNKNRELL
jgi:hypothetical protein